MTGPLAENQIAFTVRETLAGLNYLHNHGIIHRDVKGDSAAILNRVSGGSCRCEYPALERRRREAGGLRRLGAHHGHHEQAQVLHRHAVLDGA